MDLSRNQLKEIPKEIGELVTLKFLKINSNKINKVPQEIGNLVNLELLEVTNNLIETIADEIFRLTNLKVLNLGFNKLSHISPLIGKLCLLKKLFVSYNPLNPFIPDEISELKYLEELNICGTRLKKMPLSLFKIPCLAILSISNCYIREIPQEIIHLKDSLVKLHISRNKLTKIDDFICQLVHLKELDVSHNNIVEISPKISYFSCLLSLDLSGNNLSRLPNELSKFLNSTQIKIDYNQLEELPKFALNQNVWVSHFGNQIPYHKVEKIKTDPPTYSTSLETRRAKLHKKIKPLKLSNFQIFLLFFFF